MMILFRWVCLSKYKLW